MSNNIKMQLEKLKHKFIDTDVFGDAYDDLQPKYFKVIDSIELCKDKKSQIEKLNLIKRYFYEDDLFNSDSDEIQESGIFTIINDIIDILKTV